MANDKQEQQITHRKRNDKSTDNKQVEQSTESTREKDEKADVKDTNQDSKNGKQKFRYGPMPTFPHQRVWSRGILIISVLTVMWFTNRGTKDLKLAERKDIHKNRGHLIECDRDYRDEVRQFKHCEPKECGRYVMDTIVTAKEADILLTLAKKGMALGGSSGGATILDLHSGALSYGKKFLNIYSTDKGKEIMSSTDLTIYKVVRTKIQRAIESNFELYANSLHLTHPTFFSRLTNKAAKTPHDEYWHAHVDKETYESFHYTSLLYLSDHGIDFAGGKFIFLTAADMSERNITVEPRKGRVLMFTSGAENPHLVEPVTSGERYAITVSFTCNSSAAVSDPSIVH